MELLASLGRANSKKSAATQNLSLSVATICFGAVEEDREVSLWVRREEAIFSLLTVSIQKLDIPNCMWSNGL
jgi:hypothetical protein